MSKTLSQAITDLASATTPLAGTEYLLVVQSGTAKKCESEDVGGGGAAYTKYVALLSQTGTDAPTATVLENTLGGTVVWTRSGAGDYIGTLAGAFTSGKTWFSSNCEYDVENIWIANLRRVSDDEVGLYTVTPGPNSEDGFTNVAIEIRVYP